VAQSFAWYKHQEMLYEEAVVLAELFFYDPVAMERHVTKLFKPGDASYLLGMIADLWEHYYK